MPARYQEEPCKSALNRVQGMPFDWSLNPYTGCAHRCTFCYVRAFERRADRPSGDRYGTVVRVKTNLPEVLRAELARPSWKRDYVAIGAATDPYQPAEGHYRLTRRAIEALGAARTPFGIITRGPLIVRDIDVLQEAAKRASVSVSFSVPTLDPDVWRTTEPGSPPPRQRLRALKRLVDAGIQAGVGMAPIIPGLSDRPELLADVVRAAREAGATSLWAGLVYLRSGTREHFLEQLARDWPEAAALCEERYGRRDYAKNDDQETLRKTVGALKAKYGIADRRTLKLVPPEDPVQLEIAV